MPRERKDQPGSTVDLPVTPMLDMTFQLLFFFIVTFNPASAEGKLDFALPGGSGASRDSSSTLPPAVIVVSSELKLQVDTSPAGAIARIIVEQTPNRHGCHDVSELATYLQHVRKAQADRPAEVAIEAQGQLKYAALMEVVDVCNKAGFKGVGFAPPR
jgi:biopolymer transport protein ExbD